MAVTLEAVGRRYGACCAALGVAGDLPIAARDTGDAHVECRDDGWHYIATERGEETAHRVTTSEDEIAYWLVSDVVFRLACAFEGAHRVRGRSFRRLLFARELELMTALDPAWAERRRQEIDRILAAHPYDDVAEG